MFLVLGILFSGALLVVGFIFIYGTIRGWYLLVDPPNDLWLFYSQAFIKRVFGRTTLIIHNYLVGILFIILGLVGFYNGFKT